MPDKRDDQRDESDKQGDPEKGQPNKPQNPLGRWPLGWVLLILLVLTMVLITQGSGNNQDKVSWNKFKAAAEAGHFEDNIYISKDNRFIAKLKENAPHPKRDKPGGSIFVDVEEANKDLWYLELNEIGVDTNPEIDRTGLLVTILINWLPFIIFGLIIYFFIFRAMRGGGGPGGMLGNFGRSKHKMLTKEHSSVVLDDVAGIQEAKDEVGEIIEFLKNPKKFQRLGGRVPRGVMLIGPPGCGKTLLAKAVAGEADVPFFSISGSDFVEMFVGVGASRVRDLFKQAKDNSPCIIFLDEIDAVGRRRGSGFSSGGHDEREQTLNAILVEMDGFDSSDQVIVLASTNRADVLDPALTRPGRFDRQVQVHLPDILGRVEILKVHSRKIKMSPDVDLEQLARGTPMFSGAELEAIINEAAIGATMLDKDWVEMEDLEEARDKVKFGRARKGRKFEEDERVATAYHEAGHAILQHMLPDADPLHKVTIIARGGYLGASFQLPKKDRYGYGRKHVEAQMRVACGGRIAEQRKTDDATSGAMQDIRQVSAYARHMILEWGMSEKLGFIDLMTPEYNESMTPERPYSEETAKVIDEEVKRLVTEAYDDATRIIDENWDKLVDLAESLLKHETLTADEVDRLLKGESLGKTTVSDLLKAEREKKSAPGIDDASTSPGKPDDGEADSGPGVIPSPA